MRRYTLLELIVAVGVLALLATFLALGLRTTCRTGPHTRARADLARIKMALDMYQSDTRTLPRPSSPRTNADAALQDAAPALCSGLLDPRSAPNAPYMDWPRERIGKTVGGREVLLDPWGNPYHYREWASVATALKNDLLQSPPLRTGFVYPPGWDGPTIKQTQDVPHAPDTFELWSDGPNGINEYGDPFSDDVVSWRD